MDKRQARLSKPRQISDPENGYLGTMQKNPVFGWDVTGKNGLTNYGGTQKEAINLLCDMAGVRRWF